jgi:hypothetical protein
MRACLRLRIIATGALAAIALIASGAPSGAIELVSVPGMWSGFGQSAISPRLIAPCWDVTDVSRSSFHATLEIDPCWFVMEGSILPDGAVFGVGMDDDGEAALISGRAIGMADGSVRLAALGYVEIAADKSVMDVGVMALIQMSGGTSWSKLGGTNVTGDWMGSWQLRRATGDLHATLSNSGPDTRDMVTTQVTGNADFGGRGSYSLMGTAGAPGLTPFSSLALIGVLNTTDDIGPAPIVLLIGRVSAPNPRTGNPASCDGSVRLYRSVFDLFNAVVTRQQGGLDVGRFSIRHSL